MVGVLCLAASASTFLGWTVSGERTRNSYATLRSAQRLGLDELTPFRVVWFLVPVLVLLVLIGLTQGWLRSSAAIAGGLMLIVCLGALVVINSPLPIGIGPVAALLVGIPGLVASTALLILGDRPSVAKNPRLQPDGRPPPS